MKKQTRLLTVLFTVFLVAVFSAFTPAIAQEKKDTPETVFVTYHAKAGSEAALKRAIARQWTVAREMNLLNASPHVVVRGVEEGDKTYFVEISEWRDENIPDHAPPEIQAIWKEMNTLVESRKGRPGIDFVQVALVAK
jgi:hypothetical protein